MAGVTAGLGALIEVERVSPAAAPEALRAGAPELMLLDAALPATELTALLEAAGAPEAAGRPLLLLLGARGDLARAEALLPGRFDDAIDSAPGASEILPRLRSALALQGSLAELARSRAELARLRERLDTATRRDAEELRLAAKIQRALLPPHFSHPRLEVAREFLPFREIGGDFYDLLPVGSERLALGIGDVMGKGVPAALLAANLKSCLHAQFQGGEGCTSELVARVNRLFWEVTPRGQFATLFFGVVDLAAGSLEYVNAGHDYPFVVRADGSIEDLVRGGTVLGFVEDARYEHDRIALQPDDLLVLYSDGVTDRGDASGERYGVERLKEAALRTRRDPARVALYSLLGEVQGWSSGRPAEDDMTLVVARFR